MGNVSVVQARLVVSGRVQGVGFRASACQEAGQRSISGWVQNLPDGRVVVVAQGEKKAVNNFIVWCRTGPWLSQVEHVEVVWEKPEEGLEGFELRDYFPGLVQAVKTRARGLFRK